MRITANQDLYLNRAKDRAVPAGPDAAFLLKRKGGEVPRQWEHLVTKGGNPKSVPKEKREAVTKEQKPAANKTKGK